MSIQICKTGHREISWASGYLIGDYKCPMCAMMSQSEQDQDEIYALNEEIEKMKNAPPEDDQLLEKLSTIARSAAGV